MEVKNNNQPKKALQVNKRVIASRMTNRPAGSSGAGRTTTDMYTTAD